MQTFKDREGHTWELSLDIPTLRKIRDNFNFDLLLPLADAEAAKTVFGEISKDFVKLLDVLYLVLKRQCDSLDLSDEDFGRRFDQQSMQDAVRAFMEEYANFFHPQVRTAIQQSIQKMITMLEDQGVNGEMDAEIDEIIEMERLKIQADRLKEKKSRREEMERLKKDLQEFGET